MNDLINRQDAIERIERDAYRHTYLDQIIDVIKEVPSAPHWIPCSERLPEDGFYLVTNKWHHIDLLNYQQNRGWRHGNMQDTEGRPSVIAWMPLPEPYMRHDDNLEKMQALLEQIERLEKFNNSDCPEWVKNIIKGEIK